MNVETREETREAYQKHITLVGKRGGMEKEDCGWKRRARRRQDSF
jgi:hypothetical protein